MFIYRTSYDGSKRPLCPGLNTTCQGDSCMAFRERKIGGDLTLAFCAMHGRPTEEEINAASSKFFEKERVPA